MNCPLTCRCRRGGEGIFLVAVCAWAALWSPVFFGTDFAALVVGFVNAPRNAPLVLVVWTLLATAGLVLVGIGLRAAFRFGDGPPARSSLIVAAVAVIALLCGWYPHGWGAALMRGIEGVYVALIAGGIANLCLAACARFWIAGYVAAEGRGAARRRPDVSHWQTVIERQAGEIKTLTAERGRLMVQKNKLTTERDRLVALKKSLIAERDHLAGALARATASMHDSLARDVEAVLRSPGMRRAVLAVLHPDRGTSEADSLTRTVIFQKASAIFERLGVR